MRIRLRQPYERLQQYPLTEGFPIGPLQRFEVPLNHKLGGSWNLCPPEVQAGQALMHLYLTRPIPIVHHNPVYVRYIDRIAVAFLDACVFLHCDTPSIREKLGWLLGVLQMMSKTWPVAEVSLKNIQRIMDTYLDKPNPTSAVNLSTTDRLLAEGNTDWQEVLFDISTNYGNQPTSLPDPSQGAYYSQYGIPEQFSNGGWFTGQGIHSKYHT
jgi:hypothetical protein